MIPYGKHSIDQQDILAVVDVLENQFLTQGKQVPAFEEALCQYTGAQYALAVNSATSALHVACLALDVKAGDIVWTTPITFVATANCIRFCGADVDFVDINPRSRNLCPTALAQKLEIAQAEKRLPKAIIAVHFAGYSCEMQQIYTLCQQHGVKVIEDACHALGGDYQGKKIGNCRYSDFTVFSFHPVKSITTAEGGALLSNQQRLIERATLFAKHGVTREQAQMQDVVEGPWCYQQVELGFNYRMSDLQAALGITQLAKLDAFIARRRTLADNYFNHLENLPLQLPDKKQLAESAWHLYAVELKGQNRLQVYQLLQHAGVHANVHYSPVHLQPYYQKLGFNKGDFPAAEHYAEHTLTIPLFQSMTDEQQLHVVQALEQALEQALRDCTK
ncbi:UDP-4-amino-4,6-dideoxy-N-acetyl-beta-L-altrosamine transaminase [Catenovulum sediminis]|uniref:UDP-4-amino-4, 6-dideoxy-N-acetyl-beta-L-altrosamine transaminase n=1 Tax=Catenovulum sediminis TaxID=1740262 RepID=UPI00117F92E9|nr:UDP-4-amino-4,6-dideoxy-N-acetyl-beta-L-altrosamine transaminase [Catenovulum sediminis]